MKGLKLHRIVVVFAVVGMLSMAYANPAHAGSPPNRLDDNRAAAGLAVPALTLLLSALTGLPVFIIGFTFTGRVVPHPSLFNVYWGDNWDSNNPSQFSTSNIDSFTSNLVGSNYF